jgi:hypothetical protein
MKSHSFQKKPLITASRPHPAAVGLYSVTTARNTRADVRQILRSPGLQAKLSIRAPDDVYEQEADRVADEVMRMPDQQLQKASPCNAVAYLKVEEDTIQPKQLADQITPQVQRQVEEEEEELIQPKALNDTKDFALQRQPEEGEEELLQKKSTFDQMPEVTPHAAADIAMMLGGGQPLTVSERKFFESRFDADFSNVKRHTNTSAADTVQALNAKAFTLGHDIFFGAGRFAPDSDEGKRLLAHELSHVIQQRGGMPESSLISNQSATRVPSNENMLKIENSTLLQRLAIPDEEPPSGTEEDEIEEHVENKFPGTAESPDPNEPSRIQDQSIPQAQLSLDPVQPYLPEIEKLLKSVFEASFETRKPSNTERGRRIVYDSQGNVSHDPGVVLGNEPRSISENKQVFSINLGSMNFQSAEGEPLFSTEISVHTHFRYEGMPLPSDRPEQNAGDLANLANRPGQEKIYVVAREQRQHVPGTRSSKRAVRLTIIYRGPDIGTVVKPDYEEISNRRDVGRVLQKRLPGADIRVYKATYKKGKIIKWKQVY